MIPFSTKLHPNVILTMNEIGFAKHLLGQPKLVWRPKADKVKALLIHEKSLTYSAKLVNDFVQSFLVILLMENFRTRLDSQNLLTTIPIPPPLAKSLWMLQKLFSPKEQRITLLAVFPPMLYDFPATKWAHPSFHACNLN
jgi:hypothetical protein